MCGIAGYIGPAPPPRERIAAALATMRNRGPDHAASVEYQLDDYAVTLLHSRLGIVDLDPRANQPLVTGPLTLVYNGEIYNHLELRRELERAGCRFRTTCDTEVVLQAYARWGRACVERFEGMWALALWDAERRELWLSRDRFAEKPLLLHTADGGWYFASEAKTLAALRGRRLAVNQRHVARYLVNGYKSLHKTDETFFEDVAAVPYATNVILTCGKPPRLTRYWQPEARPQRIDCVTAIEQVRAALLESVRLRLRADVPLAFCLSGGVDSAALASIAAKCFGYDVATFSIVDQDERFDERVNIQHTLRDLGCRHTLIETQRGDFLQRLRTLVRYHDAPVLTISYYVHSLLSEALAAAGYRTVCSGTGADEMFTGYYDHFNLHLYETRHSPRHAEYLRAWETHTGRLVRNPYLRNPRLYFDDPQIRDHIYLNNATFAACLRAPFAEPFYEACYCDELLRNRMINEMFHEVTPAILHQDDRNSMRVSVENRSPYLDRHLYETLLRMPVELLIQQGYGKYLLREAVRGILNEPVRTDRRKVGFNASICSLIDLGDPAVRDVLLADGPIFELVDRQRIAALLTGDTVPNSVNKFLFSFVSARLFMEEFA